MTTTFLTEVHSADVAEGRMVEVHLSDSGEYWIGLTILRNPKDWTFSPRDQYGTGETGKALAIAAADRWAAGLRFDARYMKR